MKDWVFATHNKNKLIEIQQIIGNSLKIIPLNDIGCNEDIPETQDTIEGNALQKAEFVYNNYKINCFADDTGLEVETLNGAPGVYSARFAGENASYNDNVEKLLNLMQHKENRQAQFKTVIALIYNGKKHLFEGVVKGTILKEKRGHGGFGYDPIFMPENAQFSFAEMSADEKNIMSHRGIAMRKLSEFIKQLRF